MSQVGKDGLSAVVSRAVDATRDVPDRLERAEIPREVVRGRGWRQGLAVAAAVGLGLVGREALARLREADLRGQVALVTGGSRGLGLLVARELGARGCRLAICARDVDELDRAAADLGAEGFEVFSRPCDVASRAEVDRLVGEVVERYGRIDVLVNNAGIIQVGPLEQMTVADFEQAMATMFWGVLYPTLAVLPQMRARRAGRIVNVTSVGGVVAVPHLLPYDSAKFAAVGFSEGLRAELQGTGVVVTTIVPGLMRTGSYVQSHVKGQQEKEFTWLALGSSLPLISMDAERAARQIVQATRRGEAERTLSAPAAILARFHGLFPGLTADLLGLARRLVMPGPDGGTAAVARGKDIQRRVDSPVLGALTALGRSAARRFNE